MEKKNIWRQVIFIGLLVGVVIVVLLQNPGSCKTTMKKVMVQGGSMTGLFSSGDQVEVEYGYYNCNTVKRDDIVVLNIGAKNNELIKSVKAIPRDVWGIEKQADGRFAINVNGQLLRTSLGVLYSFNEKGVAVLRSYSKSYKGVIPDNTILVLGNQPKGSYDSSVFGLTSVESLRGRVLTSSH